MAVHAGVCRTDLHVTEVTCVREQVIPGHEWGGVIVRWAQRWARLSVANSTESSGWVSPGCVTLAGSASTAGAAAETSALARTGWDADEDTPNSRQFPAAFAHHLPSGYSDNELAPIVDAHHRISIAAALHQWPAGISTVGGSAHITAGRVGAGAENM